MNIRKTLEVLTKRASKTKESMDRLKKTIQSLQEQVEYIEQTHYEIMDHIQNLEQIQMDRIDNLRSSPLKTDGVHKGDDGLEEFEDIQKEEQDRETGAPK